MSHTYNSWLVCLSLGVAVLASFTALRLAARVADARQRAGRFWLMIGAVALGIGMWSMHFIGMLAFHTSIVLRYDIATTAISLAVAIVTSAFTLHIASRPKLLPARHSVCSLVMGSGIAAMHYVGMAAIRIGPAISYNPPWVIASVLIAIAASYVALGLTFRLRHGNRRHFWVRHLGAAVVMGIAIAGMHYAGMAAAQLQAGSFCRGGVALDSPWLGVTIAIFTIALLVVTLIAGVIDTHLELRARLHAERLQMANLRLRHQATHDVLTNLPNRTTFLGALESALEQSASTPTGALLAVMLIDIDRFKIVNDSLGHSSGDAVLRQAASRLQDIVANTGVAARLGGDEFLVMTRALHTQQVMAKAAEILRSLAQVYLVESVDLHLAASIGITTFPFDRSAAAALISHADEAMYEAKHRGGNGFRFFVPGTTTFTKERLQLENDLRMAPQLGQLELHYQPQVDIASGRIKGVEALARWTHPVHGWISPDEFIPLAEASDLIVEIGRWLFDAACKQTRTWHDQGFTELSVAVNFSARQFRQPDLLTMIQSTVQAHGLQPRHIDVELTETVVMSDAHRSIEMLEQLHRSGFHVEVDDFGTGYSSMSYLKRLPVSKLKIDRSFVIDLGASVKSDSIVKAIIALAHGLGMIVVAEGVETPAQRGILRAFGCDQYQGYVFSRPRAAVDIAALLAAPPQVIEDYLEERQAEALITGSR